MKKSNNLPPLLLIAYKQYLEAEKELEEAKQRREDRKATILAFLKKEQTDGYIVDGVKVISTVTRPGATTIDKKQLLKLNKALHDQCLKVGKASVALKVIPNNRLLYLSENSKTQN